MQSLLGVAVLVCRATGTGREIADRKSPIPGRFRARKGIGRQRSMAAMPIRAVISPLMTPSPEPSGEFRRQAVAEHLLDQAVPGGDRAGDSEMGDDIAHQPAAMPSVPGRPP